MNRATDVTKEAEDALIAGQVKGGPTSGYHGHGGGAGGPGNPGGSRPRSAGAGAGGTVHRAGITSARPGKTTEQVRAEMEPFRRDLSAVAKDVSVSMGIGGWEGGEEPSWVTEYKNGSDALAVVARYAKKYEQDAALVFKGARKGDPGAAPMQSLSFDRPLARPAMEVIETQLVAQGIGGWTWSKRNGKTSLIVTTVESWGGDAKKDLAAI